MQSIDEINAILEPTTGWRVELAVAPGTQAEFLELYRKTGETWSNKELIIALPRELGPGTIVCLGREELHYLKLRQTTPGALIEGESAPQQDSYQLKKEA